MKNWYKNSMPTIKNAKAIFNAAVRDIDELQGVEKIYLWGACAQNVTKEHEIVADVDIAVITNFNGDDLLAITDDHDMITHDQEPIDVITASQQYLEENGYDPDVAKFSKVIRKLSKSVIDAWAISKDQRVFHWGPASENKEDWETIKENAEKYASSVIQIDKKELAKTSQIKKNNWAALYKSHIEQEFQNMPDGWYQVAMLPDDILKVSVSVS
jgi:hypothetical protein